MKLYVLVRADLSKSQQAVQAGHAVAEFMIEHPEVWKNGTLVYLKVPKPELEVWYRQLREDNTIRMSWFNEPDIDWEMTAVAAIGINDRVRHLPLM